MDRSSGPGGRKKWVSGSGKGVSKRGSGLNLGGPVGNRGGYGGRPTGGSAGGGFSGGMGGPVRNSGRRGRGGLPSGGLVILLILFLMFGGKSALTGGLFDTGSSSQSYPGTNAGSGNSGTYGVGGGTGGYGSSAENSGGLGGGSGTSGGQSLSGGSGGQGLFGGTSGSFGSWLSGAGGSLMGSTGTSQGSSVAGNLGVLNREVSPRARDKRTVLKGNGQDTVTIMVYMCGTDLEANGGMATSDLTEMTRAQISDQVNLLVYTGGCTRWRNQVISSRTNQIYQVKNGGLTCLVQDAGNVSMTDPKTLTEFIQWCAKNYPANRNQLIFWDHGGGSISGYGYDQRHPRSGSMTLAKIDQALKNGGVDFDFIGFDACLMATMENALMLSQYGDYLIASEETEPGMGWYYTDWLTKLSQNTSLPTLDIGKQIVDDFISTCARQGQGQKTTLSVVDLAELEKTAPAAFSDFSRSTSDLIRNDSYQTVAKARSGVREFAQSSRIDQVDLVDLAENMGTEEGKALSQVLRDAIKYNLTSRSMTDSWGISIYFPYKKLSSVDSMVKTYEAIGMDAEYARCIQDFASLEASGQAASGGTSSPLPTLLGTGSSYGSGSDAELLAQLLGSFLSGGYQVISGLDSSNTGFLSGRSLEDYSGYLAKNQVDPAGLVWTEDSDGRQKLMLSDKQWDLIQNAELNVFYDDGEGYIDLGLDNVYEFDDQGNLVGEYDGTWLAINDQPVAYYFMDQAGDGEAYMVTGRVPAMLNGQQVNLILVFDEENPRGYIAGAQTDYDEEETRTVAKGLTRLCPGDTLEFLCDYYSYDGNFQNNYYLGEPVTVEEDMVISNVKIPGGTMEATYRLTDIYNQAYWTPVIGR